MYTLSKADIDFYVDVNGLRRRGEESSFRLISHSPSETGKTRAMQVLMVENDAKTIRSVTSILSHLGCQTLIAESDIDAIRLVGEHRPDVLLLNGTVSGAHSAAVARFVKSAYAEYRPRTIMVSTGEEKPESGMDGYVVRPLAFQPFVLPFSFHHFVHASTALVRLAGSAVTISMGVLSPAT